MTKNNNGLDRRSFLKSGAVAIASLAVVGAGVGVIRQVRGNDIRSVNILRPPGAVEENDFAYGCIKCGLCVQICPVQAVKLAGIDHALAYGTPYIDVREQACDFSCDSLQCVETCPTGVLDFKQYKKIGEQAITEYEKEHDRSEPGFNPFKVQIVAMKESVNMGMARLIIETCLAVNGEGFEGTPRGENFKGLLRSPRRRAKGRGEGHGKGRKRDGTGPGHGQSDENYETKASPLRNKYFNREVCDLCVTQCPIGSKAIEMIETTQSNGEKQYRPQVNDGCTGCGVCVMVCPTQKPSIIVEPIREEQHV